MPKAIKMYQKSRSSLEHNMGGWFEKKKPEPKPVAPIVRDLKKRKKAMEEARALTD